MAGVWDFSRAGTVLSVPLRGEIQTPPPTLGWERGGRLVIVCLIKGPRSASSQARSFGDVKSPLDEGQDGPGSRAHLAIGCSSNPGPLASNPGGISFYSAPQHQLGVGCLQVLFPGKALGAHRIVAPHLGPAAWEVRGMFWNAPPGKGASWVWVVGKRMTGTVSQKLDSTEQLCSW